MNEIRATSKGSPNLLIHIRLSTEHSTTLSRKLLNESFKDMLYTLNLLGPPRICPSKCVAMFQAPLKRIIKC